MDNNNLNGDNNQQGVQAEGQYSGQPSGEQGSNTRPYQNYTPNNNTQYNPNVPNNGAYNNFTGGNAPAQNSYASQVQFEEPMSVVDWLIIMLISIVPCVNIVMWFVWAFSSTEKKSKSNYFKAFLIWNLILMVLSFVIFAAIGASLIPVMQNLQ